MDESQKTIGTLVPLSAIWSTQSQTATLEAGVLFLDWIVKTGQNAWQMLPLHETQLEPDSTTKHVPSPYKGYGIGLDPRYLSESAKQQKPTDEELAIFVNDHKEWLPDYALFSALRDLYKTDNWSQWDEEIKTRNHDKLQQMTTKLSHEISQYILEQWQCLNIYSSLRKKAKENHITLIGDIPYYIAYKSPLVWAHQEIFDLDSQGQMLHVSGSLNRPDSYFGRQVWGHPLYNWADIETYQATLNFWKVRLSYSSKLFGSIRLDHAIGFFLYGSLDLNNASKDEKKKGPGAKIFEEIISFSRSLGLTIYAEDAALELKDLRASLVKLHVGGVRIFRFALNERRNIINPDYAYPHQYPANSCTYTTLHDTQPLVGYFAILTNEQKQLLAQTAKVPYSPDNKILAIRIRQKIIDSPSMTVIIPIQDWLLTEERINIPGTEKDKNDPNWQFRLPTPVELLQAPLYT